MKLYADYINEILDRECIYDDHCFITYKVYDKAVSVIDYFCEKEKRGQGYMLNLINKLFTDFKDQGIEEVYGYTDTRGNTWERSEELLLKFGFEKLGPSPDNKYYNNYKLNLKEWNNG